MKNLLITITVFLISAASVLVAGEKEVSYKTNITCGGCATSIKTAMAKVEGITETNVDVASKVVTVKYDESKVEESNIKTTINKAGYTATVQAKNAKPDEAKVGEKKECGSDKSCCKEKK